MIPDFGKVETTFKKYPFSALLRFALSRYFLPNVPFLLPDKHIPFRYFGGSIYLNLKESSMMRDRALGVYEYWKTRLFMELIEPGMTVVDVGANKGYFSLLFARLMKDKGKVLSFEPDPESRCWLERSIELNGYTSIKLYSYALSDRDGKSIFYPGKVSSLGSLFFFSNMNAEDRKPFTVETRKLDTILKKEEIENVDLIKIDVEGADLLVLHGARKTLKNENVKLVMDIDVMDEKKRQEILSFLASLDFKIYSIGKKLKPVKTVKDLGCNDIYARDILAVKSSFQP